MTWTYSGNPANSPNDAVRFEIQDVVSTSPLVQDEEIAYAISQEAPNGSPYTMQQILASAAHVAEALVRRFSMQADSQVGTLKITYSKQAQGFAAVAKQLRARATALEGPYTGGMSLSEKASFLADSDRVNPAIQRGQFDNPWTGESQGGQLNTDDLGPALGDG